VNTTTWWRRALALLIFFVASFNLALDFGPKVGWRRAAAVALAMTVVFGVVARALEPRVLASLCASASVGCASSAAAATGSVSIVKPAALYVGLNAADLGSTAYFRARGRCEGTAFLRAEDGCGVRWDRAVALGVGKSAALTGADVWLKRYDGRHGTRWRWLLRGLMVLRYGWQVADNLDTPRREARP
jgi:hypothetical protein